MKATKADRKRGYIETVIRHRVTPRVWFVCPDCGWMDVDDTDNGSLTMFCQHRSEGVASAYVEGFGWFSRTPVEPLKVFKMRKFTKKKSALQCVRRAKGSG